MGADKTVDNDEMRYTYVRITILNVGAVTRTRHGNNKYLHLTDHALWTQTIIQNTMNYKYLRNND